MSGIDTKNIAPSPPQTTSDEITEFMTRVVPWPNAGEPGVVNLCWKVCDPKSGAEWWGGRPQTDVASFMGLTQWALVRPNQILDLYFCLSLQGKVGRYSRGKPTVARSAKEALALKAIWLDVDVKDPPKGYADLSEALHALKAFIQAASVPWPNAIVQSGGGLHLYWISDRELSVDEWRPYAEGLKAAAIKYGLRADYGVTTDPARILRIPGTFNRKTEPPRPVKLISLEPDFDFSKVLAHLTVMSPAVVTAMVTNEPAFDLSAFAGKKPDGAFAALDPKESLSEGIDKKELPPLNPKAVLTGCPFYRDAMTTHGKDHTQPLWNLAVLGTVFMQNGRVFAHEIGNGHPGYSVASTDALYDRKEREHHEKGLGWPSCRAIEGEGCKLCATCPHFGKIKSPLHLALPAARTDQASIVGQIARCKIDPVSELMTLRDQGADIKTMLLAMNRTFAVVKYGSKIAVATIASKELEIMRLDDFHNMLANLRVQKVIEIKDDSGTPQKTTRTIIVSKHWFNWEGRRQYVGRGIVFEPGRPSEIPNDMLNLWRGFGVEPMRGDWSLMRNHIHDVICSGNEEHFQYLIKWMAYGVQHPDRPIGVTIALRGEEGAGKGFLWRNYGKLFGKHFRHVAQGEHLTGRLNAALAEACNVFLDEALWAGDRKGEQILKALITEPTYQLERKYFDPITVKNHLRITIASNNDWIVPVGIRGRRYCVLDVSNKYADEKRPEHKAYWQPLQAQFGDDAPDDGRGAMLYDLLHMDLRGFNVRAVPDSAAKTEQKLRSLHGTKLWLYEALQEGAIGCDQWQVTGLTINKDHAYECYREFSKQRREWQPEIKDVWSKNIYAALGPNVRDVRPTKGKERVRSFQFAPLTECRYQFANHVNAPDLKWEEPENEAGSNLCPAVGLTGEDAGEPAGSDALHDAPSFEWEPDLESESDNWPEYEPEDERESN